MKIDNLTNVDEGKQLEALRITLKKAFDTVMYRAKFDKANIKQLHIKHLKDIVCFPFTDKEDLKHYSLAERSSVPLRQILRIHTSSGTSGKPVAFGYTRKDLTRWTNNLAGVLLSMGFNQDDVVLFPAPMGLPTGLGYLPAFEKVGAKLVPTGPGRTSGLQIPAIMGEFGIKPNSLCCLPSYLLRLLEVAIKEDIDPKDLGIRKIQTGGEAFSAELKKRAERTYGATLFEGYGLAEAWGGPSIASAVIDSEDLTVWENYFLVEIIDPSTLEVLPAGEEGELVITSLQKDANPIIRYRTGDLTRFVTDFSGEFRPARKIAKIRSRIDEMVKVKGVKLYPTDIEPVIVAFDHCNGEYEVVLDRNGGREEVSINLESHQLSEAFQTAVQTALKERLNLTCNVHLLPIDTLQRSPGKSKRIKDMRPSA